jgi:acetyl/propionyl-CoA carboxylase alpha subunit
VQRRHQKIVEETPSAALTPSLRAQMGDAAVAAARAAGYVNAGTIEFLLEGDGDDARFYFLEMNTRLQVEHPVTELVTGVDLVRAQLLVASGEPLPWSQASLAQRGHAVECRIYAEDPAQGFLPQAGRLLMYREPRGPGIRVDSGVAEGGEISVFYDPMLAKLIVYGETRAAAIARAIHALQRYVVLGIRANIPFLLAILRHADFAAGAVDTSFLERERETLEQAVANAGIPAAAVAAAALFQPDQASAAARAHVRAGIDPFEALRGWGLS